TYLRYPKKLTKSVAKTPGDGSRITALTETFTTPFPGTAPRSLPVTGPATHRAGAGTPLVHGTPLPFDNSVDGQVPD
ncbi:hypothetical protein ACPXCX_58635, partial [Streptomyces sp. DT225]